MFRSQFPCCPLDGTALEPLVGDPREGKPFADRYVVERCIGEGGMGRVYRARHQRVSRKFAIKVLYGDYAADPKMRRRFAQEAEAASRLDHVNVISVVDFGETPEGQLYLVMDYAQGPSLTSVIALEGPLDAERVLRLSEQLAAGLSHAHERGLIHRDFKSDNVIVSRHEDGEVARIVDFGLAVVADISSRRLTTSGMVMGTPAYMAPEQALGQSVDHRSDLFSLGLVMYEMMAGTLPFEGTPIEIARKNLHATPPRVSARAPGVEPAPEFEALMLHLLAKKPEDRPQTARAVLEAVQAIAARAGGVARQPFVALHARTEDMEAQRAVDGAVTPAAGALVARGVAAGDRAAAGDGEAADADDGAEPAEQPRGDAAHAPPPPGDATRALMQAGGARLAPPAMPSRAQPLRPSMAMADGAVAGPPPATTTSVVMSRPRRWPIALAVALAVSLLAVAAAVMRGPASNSASVPGDASQGGDRPTGESMAEPATLTTADARPPDDASPAVALNGSGPSAAASDAAVPGDGSADAERSSGSARTPRRAGPRRSGSRRPNRTSRRAKDAPATQRRIDPAAFERKWRRIKELIDRLDRAAGKPYEDRLTQMRPDLGIAHPQLLERWMPALERLEREVENAIKNER